MDEISEEKAAYLKTATIGAFDGPAPRKLEYYETFDAAMFDYAKFFAGRVLETKEKVQINKRVLQINDVLKHHAARSDGEINLTNPTIYEYVASSLADGLELETAIFKAYHEIANFDPEGSIMRADGKVFPNIQKIAPEKLNFKPTEANAENTYNSLS